MNDMNNLFNEVEAELLKQFKAITPEQFEKDERLRKAKSDYEALHTVIETDEDRADPEKYSQEDDDEQTGD